MSPVLPAAQNSFALGWRLFWRECRSGRLSIIIAAIALSVFGVTLVSTIAERVRGALNEQAGQLLGGDLVLRADARIEQSLYQQFSLNSQSVALTAEFPSSIRSNEGFKLVSVKAVSENFPLRGAFVVCCVNQQQQQTLAHGPKPGEVWIAQSLARATNQVVGDTFKLGMAQFKIAHLLVREPDAALDYSAVAPRVLINFNDLPATELVQPGARINYALIAKGERAQINALTQSLRGNLKTGQRLETIRNARPELRQGLQRAERFLALSLLCALCLSATAMGLAAWRYAQQQMDAFAVMRSLGATSASLQKIITTQMACVASLGAVIGLLCAEFVQRIAAYWLSVQMNISLPEASSVLMVQGFLLALVMMIIFTAPLLWRLKDVPAMRVLSRQFEAPNVQTRLLFLISGAGVIGLAFFLAQDTRLALVIVFGLALLTLVLAMLATLLMLIVRRLRPALSASVSMAIAGVLRRGRLTVLSVVALGLSATALSLMGFVRTDLLAQWAKASPDCGASVAAADCRLPNRFLINVQDDQRLALGAELTESGIQNVEFWPMLRGRYTQLNGQDRPSANGARAKRLAEREFNLSIATSLPADNTIVAGAFFDAQTNKAEMSVEVGLAQLLGWQLGDRITFDLGGIQTQATITSFREVNWDNFKPNFFVLLNNAAWSELPVSWITSLSVREEHIPAFENVLAGYGNVTVLDLDFIQAQVRNLIAQVTKAIETVFWFTLICGLLVLIGTIDATQFERKLDASIMRVLGARTAQLRRFDAVEFALIGILAGSIGALFAQVMSYIIADQLLGFALEINWRLLMLYAFSAALLVVMIGLSQTRKTRRVSSLESMRCLG
jgi:putative ABC transport system permease protein